MTRLTLVPVALAFVAGIASDINGFAYAAIGAGAVIAIGAGCVRIGFRVAVIVALIAGVADDRALGHPADPIVDGHIRRQLVTVVDVRALGNGLVDTTVRFADGTQGTAELPDPPEAIGARLALRCKREPF